MKWHRYAALFPMMSDDEIQALADDIREKEQSLPCLVSEAGELIDGRNRVAACAIAGVEPKFETFHGDDDAILGLVISLNLPRRHLTESQRAMVAADLATLPKHVHKPDERDTPIGTSALTVAEAADKLKVSVRSVNRARKVKEQAAPEVQQAVRDGEVRVSRAAKIADKPIEEQPAALVAAIDAEPEPDNGEGLRSKILDRIGSELERQIRQLCDTEAGRNVDRAKALEALGKLVAAVKGQRRRVAASPADETDRQIEALWAAYPRKVGKGQARRAMVAALKVATFDVLLAAVEEYREAKLDEDMQYIPHPATWFNGRRWEDDRSDWRVRGGPPDKLAGLRAATQRKTEPAGYLEGNNDESTIPF